MAPKLPLEIISLIVAHLTPRSPVPIALPQSHATTKTLLSMLRTSRSIYPVALQQLYAHCLYINTFKRLRTLIETIRTIQERQRRSDESLPNAVIFPFINSLYLAPDFRPDEMIRIGQLSPVHELLLIIGPILKRLVLDIPTRRLGLGSYNESTRTELCIVNSIWEFLSPLKQIEVFASVSDSLDYLVHERPHLQHANSFRNIFDEWPKCRVLALYNPDLSHVENWRRWSKMPLLKRLIVNRGDGMNELDIKKAWKDLPLGGDRKFEVELVNVEACQMQIMGKADWKPNDAMSIREVIVPMSYYGDEDEIQLCRKWVTRCLLRGDETIEGCEPVALMIM